MSYQNPEGMMPLVVPKMTIRSKQVPTGSGNYYMYEQKSRRAGKKVQTDHVRYIGKGHHGGYQGPSQAVVPNPKGSNPTFYPVHRAGGVSVFRAAPTRDPFPELKEKGTHFGKNTILYTQITSDKGDIEVHKNLAEALDNREGEHHKVIRDRGNWFYVETYTKVRGGSSLLGSKVDPETGLTRFKSDKFNTGGQGIKASESAKVVPKSGSPRVRGASRGFNPSEALPKSVVPKQSAPAQAKQTKDIRSGAIDAEFRVKEGSGA